MASLSYMVRDYLASWSHLALQLSNALSILYFLALGLTPGPKFINLSRGLQQVPLPILHYFSLIAQMVYEMRITKIFHFLAWGLAPRPKFIKRGDDLLPTLIYHPAKFHHPVSTRARDIYSKILQTNESYKQKVCQLSRLAYIPTC